MGSGAIRVISTGGRTLFFATVVLSPVALADPTPIPNPTETLNTTAIAVGRMLEQTFRPTIEGGVEALEFLRDIGSKLGQTGNQPPIDTGSKGVPGPEANPTGTANLSDLKGALPFEPSRVDTPGGVPRPPAVGTEPVISNVPPDRDPFSPNGIDPNGSRVPAGVTPESIAQTKPVDGVLSQFRDLEKVKADEQARIEDLTTSKHDLPTLGDESGKEGVLDRSFFNAEAKTERPVTEGLIGSSRAISTTAAAVGSSVPSGTSGMGGSETPTGTSGTGGSERPIAITTPSEMKQKTPSVGTSANTVGVANLEKRNELEPRSPLAASQEKNKEFDQLLAATNSSGAGAKAKLSGSGRAMVDMAGARPPTKKGMGAFGRLFAWLSGGNKASTTTSRTGEKFKRPTRLASLFGRAAQSDNPLPTHLFFVGLVAGSIVSFLGLSVGILGLRFFILPFFRRKRDRRSRATQ